MTLDEILEQINNLDTVSERDLLGCVVDNFKPLDVAKIIAETFTRSEIKAITDHLEADEAKDERHTIDSTPRTDKANVWTVYPSDDPDNDIFAGKSRSAAMAFVKDRGLMRMYKSGSIRVGKTLWEGEA